MVMYTTELCRCSKGSADAGASSKWSKNHERSQGTDRGYIKGSFNKDGHKYNLPSDEWKDKLRTDKQSSKFKAQGDKRGFKKGFNKSFTKDDSKSKKDSGNKGDFSNKLC